MSTTARFNSVADFGKHQPGDHRLRPGAAGGAGSRPAAGFGPRMCHGKHQAINLGVDRPSICRLLLGVTLCIMVATAMVGPHLFLGLIIANIARQLFEDLPPHLFDSGLRPWWAWWLVAGQPWWSVSTTTRCPSACSSPWAAASTFSIFFVQQEGVTHACR